MKLFSVEKNIALSDIASNIIALFAIVIALGSLFISIDANRISKEANSPRVTIINNYVWGGITAPIDNKDLLVCRNVVQTYNEGGASTSLVGVKITIQVADKTEEIFAFGRTSLLDVPYDTRLMLNIWDEKPPDIQLYRTFNSFENLIHYDSPSLPITMDAHKAHNVYFDTAIVELGNNSSNNSIHIHISLVFPENSELPVTEEICLR